ncbi:hypothetical protein NPIL_109471 [Nephila pilipes]|uniref:Uncharacterized protein n=1 Tax=Nephila pilipes TaxID=299642 RepID=A0A8X6N5N1_NEPPI|nr:hypothetical protein NPIL_109471 [Nephila pilipes]
MFGLPAISVCEFSPLAWRKEAVQGTSWSAHVHVPNGQLDRCDRRMVRDIRSSDSKYALLGKDLANTPTRELLEKHESKQ